MAVEAGFTASAYFVGWMNRIHVLAVDWIFFLLASRTGLVAQHLLPGKGDVELYFYTIIFMGMYIVS